MKAMRPLAAIISTFLLCVLATPLARPALGAARVEGSIHFVRVEAHDASLAEVLAALSAHLGLRIRTSRALDDKIRGAFAGRLRPLIGRLLGARNYVAKYSGREVNIIIVGDSAKSPRAASTVDEESQPVAAHGRRTRSSATLSAVRAAKD